MHKSWHLCTRSNYQWKFALQESHMIKAVALRSHRRAALSRQTGGEIVICALI